jgi:hypothetical protein
MARKATAAGLDAPVGPALRERLRLDIDHFFGCKRHLKKVRVVSCFLLATAGMRVARRGEPAVHGYPLCLVDCRLLCVSCVNNVIDAVARGIAGTCEQGKALWEREAGRPVT